MCHFICTSLYRHLVIHLIKILAQTESKTAQKGLPVLTVSCLFLGDEALEGEVTRQERNTATRRHPPPHTPSARSSADLAAPARAEVRAAPAAAQMHSVHAVLWGREAGGAAAREAAGPRGRCPVPPAAGRSASSSPSPARPGPGAARHTHWLW